MLVPAGTLAVVPESQEDSHLARSRNLPIFSANYRTAKQKARRLKPHDHRRDGRRAAPVLQALVGKESRQVSYASRPLSASVSIARLLEAARDLQTAYSRLPLSDPQQDLAVRLLEDDQHGSVATTDWAPGERKVLSVRAGAILWPACSDARTCCAWKGHAYSRPDKG